MSHRKVAGFGYLFCNSLSVPAARIARPDAIGGDAQRRTFCAGYFLVRQVSSELSDLPKQ